MGHLSYGDNMIVLREQIRDAPVDPAMRQHSFKRPAREVDNRAQGGLDL